MDKRQHIRKTSFSYSGGLKTCRSAKISQSNFLSFTITLLCARYINAWSQLPAFSLITGKVYCHGGNHTTGVTSNTGESKETHEKLSFREASIPPGTFENWHPSGQPFVTPLLFSLNPCGSCTWLVNTSPLKILWSWLNYFVTLQTCATQWELNARDAGKVGNFLSDGGVHGAGAERKEVTERNKRWLSSSGMWRRLAW